MGPTPLGGVLAQGLATGGRSAACGWVRRQKKSLFTYNQFIFFLRRNFLMWVGYLVLRQPQNDPAIKDIENTSVI